MSEGQSVARERASVAKPHDFGYISLISLSIELSSLRRQRKQKMKLQIVSSFGV